MVAMCDKRHKGASLHYCETTLAWSGTGCQGSRSRTCKLTHGTSRSDRDLVSNGNREVDSLVTSNGGLTGIQDVALISSFPAHDHDFCVVISSRIVLLVTSHF
jgi:hypothetical protein